MTQTRYCSTCGALLAQDAELCGECGARYRDAPYQQRRADGPGAWAEAPRRRSRALATPAPEQEDEPVVEFLTPAQRPAALLEAPPAGWGAAQPEASARAGAPEDSPTRIAASTELDPPLDGCVPGTVLSRMAASAIDSIASVIVTVPLLIGLGLVLIDGGATLIAQILIGAGAALVVAATAVMLWLHGMKALTPGKAVLGLRTVLVRTGRPIGIGRAIGRSLILAIPLVSFIATVVVLFDPRTRRGLHDLAVGSIVVSIRAGRDPLAARPDDYARESADRFVPTAPVEVSTHDNLMTAPGAPWGMQELDPGTMWDQPVPARSEGLIERSPWAPDAAGPIVRAAARTEPAEPTSPDAPEDLDASHDHGELAAETEGQVPGEPALDRSASDDPVASQPAAPAVQAAPPVPEETVMPDWSHEDEEAREKPLDVEDLECTRVAAPRATRAPGIRVTIDDGTAHEVRSPALLGRGPTGDGEAELIRVMDGTRSISKTHLRLEVLDGALRVTDLGSTNGTAVDEHDGALDLLVPHVATEVATGSTLTLGDRTVTVELTS